MPIGFLIALWGYEEQRRLSRDRTQRPEEEIHPSQSNCLNMSISIRFIDFKDLLNQSLQRVLRKLRRSAGKSTSPGKVPSDMVFLEMERILESELSCLPNRHLPDSDVFLSSGEQLEEQLRSGIRTVLPV